MECTRPQHLHLCRHGGARNGHGALSGYSPVLRPGRLAERGGRHDVLLSPGRWNLRAGSGRDVSAELSAVNRE